MGLSLLIWKDVGWEVMEEVMMGWEVMIEKLAYVIILLSDVLDGPWRP